MRLTAVKTKKGAPRPPYSIVLFIDRMVTNCLYYVKLDTLRQFWQRSLDTVTFFLLAVKLKRPAKNFSRGVYFSLNYGCLPI